MEMTNIHLHQQGKLYKLQSWRREKVTIVSVVAKVITKVTKTRMMRQSGTRLLFGRMKTLTVNTFLTGSTCFL